jgi:hypothetical protein
MVADSTVEVSMVAGFTEVSAVVDLESERVLLPA